MHARLVPEMTITPTSCMACRTSNRPAVDLGFDFHSGQIERGRAYLCRDLPGRCGLLAGMFEPRWWRPVTVISSCSVRRWEADPRA